MHLIDTNGDLATTSAAEVDWSGLWYSGPGWLATDNGSSVRYDNH